MSKRGVRLLDSLVGALLVACGGRSELEAGLEPGVLSGAPRGTLGPVRVSGDPSGWVSQRANGVMAASLTIGDTESLFIAWQDDVPSGRSDVFVCRLPKGLPDSACNPQNLSQTAEQSLAPTVAARGERWAVAWVEGDGDSRVLRLRVSADSGRTFSPAVGVSDLADAATLPALAMDAQGNLLVAWNAAQRSEAGAVDQEASTLWFARSTDGGGSFSEPIALPGAVPWKGPAVAVDASGRIYVTSGSRTAGQEGLKVWLGRSDDGGESFVDTGWPYATFERPALAADASGNLFLLWQAGSASEGVWGAGGLVSSRTADGGQNFDHAYVASSPLEHPLLAIGATNEIVAGWESCTEHLRERDLRDCTAFVSRSTDTGLTFREPRVFEPRAKTLALAADGSRAWLAVSERIGLFGDLRVHQMQTGVLAGVQTLTGHQTITPAGIGADAVGPALRTLGDGTLALAWIQRVDRLPSDHSGVFFCRSEDGGATFSEPARIADFGPPVDGQGCAISELTEWSYDTAFGFRSWVALSPGTGGDLLIAWPNATPDPNDACQRAGAEILVSRSRDGGRSFGKPVNLSRLSDDAAGRIPSYGPSIARIAPELVLVGWQGYAAIPVPCPLRKSAHAFAAVSRDGGDGFSPATSVSGAVDPGFCGAAPLGRTAAISGGSAYMAWVASSAEEQGGQALVLARSDDRGNNFVPVASHDFGVESLVSELALTVDSAGQPALGYRIEGKVFATRLAAAGVLETPTLVGEGSPSASALELQSLGDDRFTLLWNDRPSATVPADILRADWSTGSRAVSSTRNLTQNAGDSDRPRAAVGRNGTRYLVWQDDTGWAGTTAIYFGVDREGASE